MKSHCFFVTAAGLLVLQTWLDATAVAQVADEQRPVLVEYVAPTPDCVSSDAFQALLKGEVARFPSAERGWRFSVRIVRQDGLYAGTLTTETGGVRAITAARCEDVTAALAVIIAVAEPSAASPSDSSVAPVQAHAPTPALVDAATPNEHDHDRADDASRSQWRVGARGFASTHPSWGRNLGGLGVVSIELPWGFRKTMFELGAGMSKTTVQEPPAMTYVLVDSQACLLDVPIADTWLSVLGCLRLSGAAFRSSGSEYVLQPPSARRGAPDQSGGALWGGATARLRWQTPTPLFVEVNVDAMYGTVSEGEDDRPAWLALGLGVGLRI